MARETVLPATAMHCYRPAPRPGLVRGMGAVRCSVTGLVDDARKDVHELLVLLGPNHAPPASQPSPSRYPAVTVVSLLIMSQGDGCS